MTTPVPTTEKNPTLPTGDWSVALRDQLAKEAIARMGPDASQEHKLAVMAELVEKLKALREYDRFDPKQMDSVVAKRNYREVGKIDVGSHGFIVQVLPDGRIVSGAIDGSIRIWERAAHGEWNSDVLSGHTDKIGGLQYLPDGRIVSGSYDKTIQIWTQGADRQWRAEKVAELSHPVSSLLVLPDGRIVSGSGDHIIRIWSKDAEGRWNSEALHGHEGHVMCLQALPDGRIVSGSGGRNGIRIWTKGADGIWSSEIIGGERIYVYCLHALSDDRIVSGSTDNKIRIWTKGSDGLWSSEELVGHGKMVYHVQVLPDNRIVSCAADGAIRIWTKVKDPHTGSGLRPGYPASRWRCEVLERRSKDGVTCLQVLPDGRIFSCAYDRTIRIWDGEEIAGGES